MVYTLNGRHDQCEIQDCTREKSHPSAYCWKHRCANGGNGRSCPHPTALGDTYCNHCVCGTEGCPKARHRCQYNYWRMQHYCRNHRCTRCTTRPRVEGFERCEDCLLLCHKGGDMCHADRAPGSMFCVQHTCQVEGCAQDKDDCRSFCAWHVCRTYQCQGLRLVESDSFCRGCLWRCAERGCHNIRPLALAEETFSLADGNDKTRAYYCEIHGCTECHAAPRYSWTELRRFRKSVYCMHHHEKSVRSDLVVYELYKARKMVEAAAVVDAGGRLGDEHGTLQERVVANRLPGITMEASTTTGSGVVEGVFKSLLCSGLRDDVFTGLMDYFSRRVALVPATPADLDAVLHALEPVAQEINGKKRLCIESSGTPMPRICPDMLLKPHRVSCCNGEAMYRVSTIVRDHSGDGGYTTDRYAWTLPCVYVDGFATASSTPRIEEMIRFDLLRYRDTD